MNYIKKILIIFLPLLLIACMGDPAIWDGDEPHQNRVSVTQHNYQLRFKQGETTLSDSQKQALKLIFDKNNYIRDHAYLSSCNLGTKTIKQRQLLNVSRYITSLGYTPVISHAQTKMPQDEHCINMSVERLAIINPNCPDTQDTNSSVEKINSNFGCSTAKNLGLMIADPRDLQAEISTDNLRADRAALSVQKYDEGEQTQFEDNTIESDTEVNIYENQIRSP